MEYLSRHGVHAELQVAPEGETWVAPILVDHAERMSAQTLVIGGYSHTRIGEYIFGGVTRSFLNNCPIVLVVAH